MKSSAGTKSDNSRRPTDQPSSRATAQPRQRPPLALALFQFVGVVASCVGIVILIARGTAADGGFLPFSIEPPVPESAQRGYTERYGVSRIRRRSKPGDRPRLIRNAASGYRFAPELGIASWYGYDHIGRLVATGKMFNPEATTAAHKTLPLGSIVRVTREDAEASVVVTINDRGPYIEGRIIDLARESAVRLGLLEIGIAPCRVEVLRYPAHSNAADIADADSDAMGRAGSGRIKRSSLPKMPGPSRP